MYTIQQKTQFQWEPIPNGDYESPELAVAALRQLEADLAWDNLRVVDADGRIVETGVLRNEDDDDTEISP